MSSIGRYILAMALFPIILMAIDAFVAYKRGISGATEPRGISGFRRSIIALYVVFILGMAIFHLLGQNASNPNSIEIVRNVLSMLAGLVAAITGFYFGGRFTERPTEAEKRVAEAEAERRGKEAEKRAEAEKAKREEAERRAKEAEEKSKKVEEGSSADSV